MLQEDKEIWKNIKGIDYLIEQELLDEMDNNKKMREKLESKIKKQFDTDYPLTLEEVFKLNKN